MNTLYLLFSLLLLCFISIGMLRIFIGPTAADRMLAAQLFGTCGVAILLLMAKTFQNEALLDIAMVFSLFAALATMTFTRRFWN